MKTNQQSKDVIKVSMVKRGDFWHTTIVVNGFMSKAKSKNKLSLLHFSGKAIDHRINEIISNHHQ